MKVIHFIATILFCMISLEANSAMTIINQCQITPQVWLPKTPPLMQKTNNLRRSVGSSEFAKGTPILLEGIVTDERCIPITDAIVEIWQANSKGWLDYKNIESERTDYNFIGTGSTNTDNMGNYSFITIMPGAIKSQAPHINIRVRHKDFPVFESVVYFENSYLNSKDRILNREVSSTKRNLLIAKEQKYSKNDFQYDVLYQFNITIDGRNKYKKY